MYFLSTPATTIGRGKQDITTTGHLMAAGRILGIEVVDHMIVTRDSRRWHSMLSSGTLPHEA